MSTGLSNKLVAQTGEFLVCAELGRRGLIATPFAGNVPTYDVLATDEACNTVPIQVKATRGTSWPSRADLWMDIIHEEDGVQRLVGPKKILHPELIYVCVAVAMPGDGERDQFFVLTRAQVQAACIAAYTGFMEKHQWRRPRNPKSLDCRYGISRIEAYRDKWQVIAERLEAVPTAGETIEDDLV
jgi:hypothetical protein